MRIKKSVLDKTIATFDLPGRIARLCWDLGGDMSTVVGFRVKTLFGDLVVVAERGAIVTTFAEAARAYAKLPDVRYPTGQWLFSPASRLSDLSGPTEVVSSLSELQARFAARLRAITLRINDRSTPLTTDVVATYKASMHPQSRTPK